MNQEKVIVIDFGGQYNQLVARRVRECNVYCEIYSYKTPLEQIKAMNPKGIILTGGPNSCYEEGSPTCTKELFELGVPVLGLCYGAQLMQHVLGGKVEKAPVREYGKTETFVDKSSALFGDVSEKTIVWMSHFDYISQVAPGFKIIAHTADCPVAAAECKEKNLYAIQFHPEVLHTQEGTKMLHNFVRGVCGCAGTWKMDAFVENTIKEIREKVGDGKVLLALSGGVDSSVAAGLLSRAIGKQLTCVFVDHGLLRKNEGDEVEGVFGPNGQFDLNFIRVNAQERYYSKLAGVTEPEAKRKIIGEEFIRVFEEEAKKIGAVDFLAQGTIYPDVVESGLGGESAVIKSHHNVGGLPDFVDFKEIIEPLRNLFKDEVRKAGLKSPVVFMLYYNTVYHYGVENFVNKCIENGVDGLIIPDLPFEEQGEIKGILAKNENSPILIQLVSPVSKGRIPMLLENARGFVYCVSQMGVTGKGANFHSQIREYLTEVKKESKIPVMMGFGIRTAADVAPLEDIIDGAIVGSHFIKLLEANNYSEEAATDYVATFKKELNA